MLWKELISIPKWTALGQLPFRSSHLGRNLYAIDTNQYCLVTPYANKTFVVKPGGPFVSALLWACGDGAALRAVAGEVEKDEKILVSVPSELLPAEAASSYHTILCGLKSKHWQGISEFAAYRISTDGAFIHRVIDSNLASYCFRSLEKYKDELPYAILWKLWPQGSNDPK